MLLYLAFPLIATAIKNFELWLPCTGVEVLIYSGDHDTGANLPPKALNVELPLCELEMAHSASSNDRRAVTCEYSSSKQNLFCSCAD